MRPQFDLRARRACAAMAALGLTYAVTTNFPLAAAGSPAAEGANVLPAQITGAHLLRYGQRVAVTGHLPDGRPHVPLALEYQPAHSAAWTTLSSGVSAAGGTYRLTAPVTRSGSVRVAETSVAGTARAGQVLEPGDGSASPALPVVVHAGLGLHRRSLDVLDGHGASVSGTVRPAAAGRVVTLQLRNHGRWATVARSRTGAQGRFQLRYTPHGTGSRAARLRFGGDAANAPTVRGAGQLNVYRLAGASWYGPGGTTACGQSLDAGTMGVANKTLPCGTMVTLRYSGRTMRVPVIDRGPYVAGREFDLTAATKAALGFGDTGEVWTTA